MFFDARMRTVVVFSKGLVFIFKLFIQFFHLIFNSKRYVRRIKKSFSSTLGWIDLHLVKLFFCKRDKVQDHVFVSRLKTISPLITEVKNLQFILFRQGIQYDLHYKFDYVFLHVSCSLTISEDGTLCTKN